MYVVFTVSLPDSEESDVEVNLWGEATIDLKAAKTLRDNLIEVVISAEGVIAQMERR